MKQLLESRSNKKVKYIKKLARRRFREKEGKFIVEGLRAVEEILEVSKAIDFVVYNGAIRNNPRGSELLSLIKGLNLPAFEVDENIFKELSSTETPQGILAVVCRPEISLKEIMANAPTLLVLVDGIQDPGNLGTLVRTCAAIGVDGMILLPGTVDLYNTKTLRSTMGNIFKIPIVIAQHRDLLLKELKSSGLHIIVGEPESSKAIFEVDLTVPVVIAVGNEGNGVQEDLCLYADNKVKIPMSAGIDSLNVAVASGIMLYEVVRQRLKQKPGASSQGLF